MLTEKKSTHFGEENAEVAGPSIGPRESLHLSYCGCEGGEGAGCHGGGGGEGGGGESLQVWGEGLQVAHPVTSIVEGISDPAGIEEEVVSG